MWGLLPIEIQQLITSYTGEEELYKKLWGENIPASMLKNINAVRFIDLTHNKKTILCCRDVICEGELKGDVKKLFVRCFKNRSFENVFYLYLCLFPRLNEKERSNLILEIKTELEQLRNYVVHFMKLIMHKIFDEYYHYRYRMIFANEEDLICTILVAELYKIDDQFHRFIIDFRQKIVTKKWTHTLFSQVRHHQDTIDSCLLWDIPWEISTDEPNEMLSDICKKFIKTCFDSCFYCNFFKIFCCHLFKFQNLALYKIFLHESLCENT